MEQYNYIREHTYKLPSLLTGHFERLHKSVVQFMPDETLKRVEHIIVTGCGYSYIAALYAKCLFEEICHIPVEVPFSIDCSRAMNPSLFPKDKTMFIGISKSGIVARVAECLERMRRHGIMTVAVTSDRSSRCAAHGEYLVGIDIPEIKESLPLCNFAVTLLFFLILAKRTANVKQIGEKKDTAELFDTFMQMERKLKLRLPSIEHQVNGFAEHTAGSFLFEFVGSGSDYLSAWLGRQLMTGQTGKPALECSTEDWLHSTFFMCRPEEIATIFIKSSFARSESLDLEVLDYLAYLKRRLCVITDEADGETTNQNRIVLPPSGHVLLDPFTHMIPIALLAGKICELTGEQYSRGFRDRWDFSKGGFATEHSKIEIY